MTVRYEAPDTVQAAVQLLAGAQSGRILAGGTDLLVQMRSGRLSPDVIVDIKRIPEFLEITQSPEGLRFGSAVPCMQLMAHDGFVHTFPGVAEAANVIGSVQVRGRATMVGNLCNASPAADSVPALLAADAQVRIQGPQGMREVPVDALLAGPGRTNLARDEIIESIFLPQPAPRSGMAYLRFTPRTEMDIAVVGAGVRLTLDESGICTDAKVCLGAVGATALVVPEAAQAIIGTRVDAAALKKLEAAASAAARPISDKRAPADYRTRIVGVMARRSAEKALERAQEELANG